MGFLSLIGGAKGIGILAIILAILGYGTYQHFQIVNSKAALVTAEAKAAAAVEDRDKAINANSENLATIEKMKAEKQAVNEALLNIKAAQAKDAKIIDVLSRNIKDGATNPENQIKLSPVIKQVLDNIQRARNERAGVKQ